MIKILHTGDIHLGDLAGPTKDGANLRRQDTLRCMDAIVNKARTEGPTVTIIAGDLFNRSRVWADTALDDVNDAISRFIVPLCEYSDAVVLLFGTMNHDNPRAFEVIRKATPDLKNLHIYTEPRVERLVTSEGPVQIMAAPGFASSAPAPTRRRRTGTPPPLSTTSSWGWLRSWTGASPPSSRPTTR